MAWYVWYKRVKPFRTAPFTNWVRVYKKYLYDCWYNSLSEEERAEWDELVRKDKEEKDRKNREDLARLACTLGILWDTVSSVCPDSYYTANDSFRRLFR